MTRALVKSTEWCRSKPPEDVAQTLSVVSLWRSPVTIGLTALCLVIALLPGLNEALQFDRPLIVAGEWWRLVVCHFTHFSNEHLAWDLLVFAALGSICERADRRQFLAALVAATLSIPLGLWLLEPTLETYRGLSGLDTALFAWLGAVAFRSAFREQNWIRLTIVATLLLCLAGKITFEGVVNRTLFVDAQSAGFRPIPMAHLIGALVGGMMGSSARPR